MLEKGRTTQQHSKTKEASLWARTQGPDNVGSPLPSCTAERGVKAAHHQHLSPPTQSPSPSASSAPPRPPPVFRAVGADKSPCLRAHTLAAQVCVCGGCVNPSRHHTQSPHLSKACRRMWQTRAVFRMKNRPWGRCFCSQSPLHFLIKTTFEIRKRKGKQQLPTDQELTGIQARRPEIILLVALN